MNVITKFMKIIFSYLLKFITCLLILLYLSQATYGQHYSKWISENDFSFEKMSESSWLNKKWGLNFSVVSKDESNIVLYDSKNSTWIKLSPNTCFTSKDGNIFTKYSIGRWQSTLPQHIHFIDKSGNSFTDNTNVKYGQEINLTVLNNDGFLAPDDNWIWYEIKSQEKNEIARGENIVYTPESNCKIVVESEKDPKLGFVTGNIFVDTESHLPDIVVENNRQTYCNTETPKLLLNNGILGKGAVWVLLSDGQIIDATRSDFFNLNISVPKEYTFTVYSKVGSTFSADSRSIQIKSATPTLMPTNFKLDDDIPCNEQTLSVNLIGSKLGEGANWKYKIVNNDGKIYKEVVSMNDTINFTYYNKNYLIVDAESTCNSITPYTVKISERNGGRYVLPLRDAIAVNNIDYKPKDAIVLDFYTNDDVAYYKFEWKDLKTNELLSNESKLNLQKINRQTDICLSVHAKCETKQFYFKPSLKWDKEEADRIAQIDANKLKKKNNRATIKTYKINDRRNIKESKIAERKNKKDTRVTVRKNKKNSRESSDVYLDLIGGLNNPTGLLGLQIRKSLVDNLLFLDAGGGYSTWGYKFNTGVTINSEDRIGYSFSAGISYNTGIKNYSSNELTVNNTTETICLNLLPQLNIYGMIGKYYKLGKRSRFYIQTGYSYSLSKDKFQQVSGATISNDSKNLYELLSPHGLILSMGLSFGL